LKTRSGVAPLLRNKEDPSSIKHGDKDKSEILQKQFCQVFTVEPPGETPTLSLRTNSKIESLEFTENMVLTKLLKLNAWKSCGKDEVHAYLLKELAHEICPGLTAIFNHSLVSGVIPLDWRFAIISPIFKKGSKKLAENYRPVSLTSVACKILESLVREKLICFLKENKLLSEKQFGFLGQRSTILQLLNYLDYCAGGYG